jgi:hypothetical protein
MTDRPTPNAGGAPDTAAEVAELARGISELLRRLGTLPEPQRRTALAAVEGIEALHRDGLSRMIGHFSRDERGQVLLGEVLEDPVVRTMLAVHGFLRAPGDDGAEAPAPLPSDPSRMVIRIDEPPGT